MIRFGLVFLYILVEFLLDYVLKFDFRQKWSTHAPYIIMEYIALFSLIGIAFDIDRGMGISRFDLILDTHGKFDLCVPGSDNEQEKREKMTHRS